MIVHPDSPAYPETHVYHWHGQDKEVGETDNVLPRYMSGLTKREYIAVEAMKSNRIAYPRESSDQVARNALADVNSLIAELSK